MQHTPDPTSSERDSRRFIRTFIGLVATTCLLLSGSLLALAAADRLPPPPLSGTLCMDAKFVEYRERFAALDRGQPIGLLAVGSSATARNLDMRELLEVRPELAPYNAAMCYLHVHQTAFLTAYLLARIPDVRIVLVVTAPRDFERCELRERAYFDVARVDGFVRHGLPAPLVYATSLRPGPLYQSVLAAVTGQAEQEALSFDPWGSHPMTRSIDWMPAPKFDDACLDALRELEATVTAHGARLVLVHVPVAPQWKTRFDPDGLVVAAHRSRVRQALTHATTLILEGDAHRVEPREFADPVHLLWPSTGAFTRFIAARLR